MLQWNLPNFNTTPIDNYAVFHEGQYFLTTDTFKIIPLEEDANFVDFWVYVLNQSPILVNGTRSHCQISSTLERVTCKFHYSLLWSNIKVPTSVVHPVQLTTTRVILISPRKWLGLGQYQYQTTLLKVHKVILQQKQLVKTATAGLPMEFLAIPTLALSPVIPTLLEIQKENWGARLLLRMV